MNYKDSNMSISHKKRHIILDVDETLLTSICDSNNKLIGITTRPYLKEFLEFCLSYFASINVWTAASTPYFSSIKHNIPYIDKFNKIYCEDKCDKFVINDHRYGKYTTSIKNIDNLINILGCSKEEIIIIDDNPLVNIFNNVSYIPILPFYGQDNDKELLSMINTLKTI
ncbi:NLI interacting factor-like phosphatase [Orpheovirus IHUMI-LCC2]|uniref:NLI interacting factor-like phosphatase n=1 Tax=Orpheovirus IHUMI-LCC2 TaxID=2023057 RepID=A0A2I2L477_9VIRU|nr:NLI interacting factor-like phosphatase [Orpheovirus IHUMI-LCC2]SNW62269.1 NLI interacting factor-like phosphatase [Orpheovirus IHUMI-LCC2]